MFYIPIDNAPRSFSPTKTPPCYILVKNITRRDFVMNEDQKKIVASALIAFVERASSENAKPEELDKLPQISALLLSREIWKL